MKIVIAAIGKQKFAFYGEAEHEYLSRIEHYADIEIIRSKESTPQKEGEWFFSQMKDRTVIVLEEKGKRLDTNGFAKFVQTRQTDGKDILFIIGGHDGVPKNVAEAATYRLSLSSLTFTHLLVPTILLEQLYRAFTILEGHPYHRA